MSRFLGGDGEGKRERSGNEGEGREGKGWRGWRSVSRAEAWRERKKENRSFDTTRESRGEDGREDAREMEGMGEIGKQCLDQKRLDTDLVGQLERRGMVMGKGGSERIEWKEEAYRGIDEDGDGRSEDGDCRGGAVGESQVDITSFPDTEKEWGNEKGVGLSNPKFTHQDVSFQDRGCHTAGRLTEEEGMGDFDRFHISVLQPGGERRLGTVLGNGGWKQSVYAERNAIWSEHSSLGIHEGFELRIPLDEENMGSERSSLLGRLPLPWRERRSFDTAGINGGGSVHSFGFCGECEEVDASSKPGVSIPWLEVEHGGDDSLSARREKDCTLRGSEEMDNNDREQRSSENESSGSHHWQACCDKAGVRACIASPGRVEREEGSVSEGEGLEWKDGVRLESVERDAMVEEGFSGKEREEDRTVGNTGDSEHRCITLRGRSIIVLSAIRHNDGNGIGRRSKTKACRRISGKYKGTNEGDGVGSECSVRSDEPVRRRRKSGGTIANSLEMGVRDEGGFIKRKGVGCSKNESIDVSEQSEGEECEEIVGVVGQHNDSELYKPVEDMQIPLLYPAQTRGVSRGNGRSDDSVACSRITKPNSGQTVQTLALRGLSHQERHLGEGTEEPGSVPNNRLICIEGESSVGEVLCTRWSDGHCGCTRCHGDLMEEGAPTGPPANQIATSMLEEDRKGESDSSCGSTNVGRLNMDGRFEEDGDRMDRSRGRKEDIGGRSNHDGEGVLPPSRSNGYVSNHWSGRGVTFALDLMKAKGSIDMTKGKRLLGSLMQTTLMQYSKGWIQMQKFLLETGERKIENKDDANECLEDFLFYCDESGKGPSTVKHFKCAAQLLLGWIVRVQVGQSPRCSSLMKAIQLESGNTTRLIRMWDVEKMLIVIESMGSNETLSVRQLNQKGLCLLLLLASMRFTEMMRIDIDKSHLEVEKGIWHLHTLRKGKRSYEYVMVARMTERILCCPFSVINELACKTRRMKGKQTALFLAEDGSRPLRYEEARALVGGMLERCDAPGWLTPYMLKHLGISLLYKGGMKDKVVKTHTGHSDSSDIPRRVYNIQRDPKFAQTMIVTEARTIGKKEGQEGKRGVIRRTFLMSDERNREEQRLSPQMHIPEGKSERARCSTKAMIDNNKEIVSSDVHFLKSKERGRGRGKEETEKKRVE